MDKHFWLDKWHRNEIGFHEDFVHPLLEKYWHQIDRLGSDKSQTRNVFVPLCGKSLDLIWLKEQGLAVFGVELSEIAVSAFFAEHGFAHERQPDGDFIRYAGDGITIWCGDYFALEKLKIPAMNFFYDRAAFVALAPEMRLNYLSVLRNVMVKDAWGLMITLEYPENSINPPPHSITPAIVEEHCEGLFDAELLTSGSAEVKGKPSIEHLIRLKTKS